MEFKGAEKSPIRYKEMARNAQFYGFYSSDRLGEQIETKRLRNKYDFVL
jgi:hypothetical protein